MTEHQIGDIANGHILTPAGTWEPIAEAPAKRKHRVRNTAIIGGSLLLLVAACGSVSSGDSTSETKPAATAEATPGETDSDAAKETKPEEEITKGQENALRSAKSYLEFAAFSKQGLIDQLSSDVADGYSKAEAKWAVSQLDVDWNEQAVKAGENYLEMSGFSRQGLIEQLSSDVADKFTEKQATYAADKLGL